MKILYIISLIFLISAKAHTTARSNANYFNVFGAFGALGSIGSIRAGGNNYEVGLLNQKMFGVNYIYNLTDVIYTPLGIGLTSGSVGVYTGIGFEFVTYSIVDLRFEAGAMATANNDTLGTLLIGANIAF